MQNPKVKVSSTQLPQTKDPLLLDIIRLAQFLLRLRLLQKAASILLCSAVLSAAVVYGGIYYTPINDVIVYCTVYSFWLTSCLPWLIKNLNGKVLLLVIQVLFRLFAAEIGFLAWGAYRGHRNVLQRGLRMRPMFEQSMSWFADAGYNLRYGVLVAAVVASTLAALLDRRKTKAAEPKDQAKQNVSKNSCPEITQKASRDTDDKNASTLQESKLPANPDLSNPKLSLAHASLLSTETESEEVVQLLTSRTPTKRYISAIGGKKYITEPVHVLPGLKRAIPTRGDRQKNTVSGNEEASGDGVDKLGPSRHLSRTDIPQVVPEAEASVKRCRSNRGFVEPDGQKQPVSNAEANINLAGNVTIDSQQRYLSPKTNRLRLSQGPKSKAHVSERESGRGRSKTKKLNARRGKNLQNHSNEFAYHGVEEEKDQDNFGNKGFTSPKHFKETTAGKAHIKYIHPVRRPLCSRRGRASLRNRVAPVTKKDPQEVLPAESGSAKPNPSGKEENCPWWKDFCSPSEEAAQSSTRPLNKSGNMRVTFAGGRENTRNTGSWIQSSDNETFTDTDSLQTSSVSSLENLQQSLFLCDDFSPVMGDPMVQAT